MLNKTPAPPPTFITNPAGTNRSNLSHYLPKFALAPQASVGGELFPSQVLPYLQPLLQKIRSAATDKQEIILINATTPERKTLEAGIADRHDLLTFAASALASDPALRQFKVIIPEDEGNRHFAELVQRVNDADEVKSSDRKYILLLTDNCLTHACSSEADVRKFLTKLSREHFGKIIRLDAPGRQEVAMPELWANHLKTASIEEIRKALMEAALNPKDHPMAGLYPKLRSPFPAKDDSGLETKYQQQYHEFLQLLQMSLWYPHPMMIILWGEPSTGKSTLMRGAANLYHQLGLGSNYMLLRDGKIRTEGTESGHATGFSATRQLHCIDQLDEANGEIIVDRTGSFEATNPAWKLMATSNLTPEDLLRRLDSNFRLTASRVLSNNGNGTTTKDPILRLDLSLDQCWRLGEENQLSLTELANPQFMNSPIIAFIRWEGTQWNVDPAIIELSQFLFPAQSK